ncbi:MAG TPA: ribonuclease P protein component [Rickettsiales bacterium]|nr:ribonuclease P protein component [Rickettsiales bacterium]
MIILPIKSRQQIVKERNNPKSVCTSGCIILFTAPTPEKNLGVNSRYRANEFVRLCLVVSKKIHKKAVIRNKLRRRIKEAFKMVDKNLFENKNDYQILVRHSIFYSSVPTIKYHIERCLKGEGIMGVPEKKTPAEIKKIKKQKDESPMKTADILKRKLK